MAGFCLAIPGVKPSGEIYLHSHMLGVLPEWRDAGIGKLLKLEQRRDAPADPGQHGDLQRQRHAGRAGRPDLGRLPAVVARAARA